MNTTLSPAHIKELEVAFNFLEHPGFLVRLASFIGKPLEFVVNKIPGQVVSKVCNLALHKAMDLSIVGMDANKNTCKSRTGWYKVTNFITGTASGWCGLPALSIELPVTTCLILRSVADIARNNGEDISKVETRLACLEVFAMGGRTSSDDLADSAYYTTRYAMADAFVAAIEHVAQNKLGSSGAPVIIRFIEKIAERFSLVVTEKLLAQSLPILGAIGGGTLNTVFTAHFQNIAKGHFTVRRLERIYGSGVVRDAYRALYYNSKLQRVA